MLVSRNARRGFHGCCSTHREAIFAHVRIVASESCTIVGTSLRPNSQSATSTPPCFQFRGRRTPKSHMGPVEFRFSSRISLIARSCSAFLLLPSFVYTLPLSSLELSIITSYRLTIDSIHIVTPWAPRPPNPLPAPNQAPVPLNSTRKLPPLLPHTSHPSSTSSKARPQSPPPPSANGLPTSNR